MDATSTTRKPPDAAPGGRPLPVPSHGDAGYSLAAALALIAVLAVALAAWPPRLQREPVCIAIGGALELGCEARR